MHTWSVFENYFKAGNYLQTTDEHAFSKVKYYFLEISHPERSVQNTVEEK